MKTKEIYFDALQHGYTLGAFNFFTLEVLNAILDGAASASSPVIAQVSENGLAFMGDDYIQAIIKTARAHSKTPVIFHLDHGKSYDVCKKAIALGFDSIMIDASSLPFEQNVALTKRVVDYAHQKGIWVEGEIGALKGVEDDISVSESDACYTNPDEAARFVSETNVDSLAIAIGTSHGINKFVKEPKLRIDILTEIEKRLGKFPLVLHGASMVNQDNVVIINENGGNVKGSKGVPNTLLKEAITGHNIVKVNVDSDLRLAFTAGVRKSLFALPDNVDLKKYIKSGADMVQNEVKNRILEVLKPN